MRTELTNMKPNDNKEVIKPVVQKPVKPAKKVEKPVDQKRVNSSKPSLKPGVWKRVIIPTKVSNKNADIPLTVAKYVGPKQADNPFLVDKFFDRKPVDPHNPSVYTEEGFLVSEEEENKGTFDRRIVDKVQQRQKSATTIRELAPKKDTSESGIG